MMKYSQEDLVRLIRAAVLLSSQKNVAANLGCSQQFLCDILKGRRRVTDRIAASLGFERIEYFAEVKPRRRSEAKP